jgi:hypothetical protein
MTDIVKADLVNIPESANAAIGTVADISRVGVSQRGHSSAADLHL